ncbi:hypothetical protein ACFSC6_10815 [Rufibacter sediminis]|uniref:Uncharacterized protein n=1 Tax=Rufibacter sediminis TaxID=2762756 RepID=A0ABR6VPA5_9BACT|nr:hypothetical protein [Rufibacter sediminis]MBC3539026.1 hypothetical protein [Rufibacter sediminis]
MDKNNISAAAKGGVLSLSSKRNWFLVALANLVVVAFLGLLLRYMFVGSVFWVNYKYLLHAHSHVALLGWLYAALFVALLVSFLPEELRNKPTYTWQFWLSQGAVLGMLVSFPIQGYAPASITFSTAHLLLSYWFIYQFLKDAKTARVSQGKHRFSFRLVKAALFFLALSSLGPLAMAPIMATGHSGSEMYYNAIYFYLHFQYNGWFVFAVLGLLFWLLEHHSITFPLKTALAFFKLMFWACSPAYLLSVLWTKPNSFVFLLAGAAALVQLVALALLLQMLWPARGRMLNLFGNWGRGLLVLASLAFVLKTGMQLLTAFPYMAELAVNFRLFIIGYLHLVLIGCISLFVFAFFAKLGWISFKRSLSRWGMGLFLSAFILTEALLFLQGTFFWLNLGPIPGYYLLLFGISILLPLGILLFFLAQLGEEPKMVDHQEVPARCALAWAKGAAFKVEYL